MSTTYPFISPYDLAEFPMNAGTSQELVFAIYDEYGNPISLSGATIVWRLCPFGSSTSVCTKNGVSGSATNQFRVYLTPSDTLALSGKHVQQYYITDVSGSAYSPSNGLVSIFPAFA